MDSNVVAPSVVELVAWLGQACGLPWAKSALARQKIRSLLDEAAASQGREGMELDAMEYFMEHAMGKFMELESSERYPHYGPRDGEDVSDWADRVRSDPRMVLPSTIHQWVEEHVASGDVRSRPVTSWASLDGHRSWTVDETRHVTENGHGDLVTVAMTVVDVFVGNAAARLSGTKWSIRSRRSRDDPDGGTNPRDVIDLGQIMDTVTQGCLLRASR